MKNNRNNTSAAPLVHSYFGNLLTAAIPAPYFLQLIQTCRVLLRLQVNPEVQDVLGYLVTTAYCE